MTAATEIAFENTFVRDLDGLYLPWQAAPAPDARLVLLNESLAGELGLANGGGGAVGALYVVGEDL